IDPAILTKVRDAVRNGATLLLSGAASPLLQTFGPWQATRPDPGTALVDNTAPAPAPRSDVVIADFEGANYHGWTVEGTAFGPGPSAGTEGSQQAVSGFHGHGLVNTYRGGDEPQGRMTSDPFTIARHSIRLLVGGGSSPETAVHLLVDGKVVRSASGHDNERLDPVLWDVSDLQGQQARIEIVDHASGAWGHINVDDIVMTDRADDAAVLQLLSQLIPAAFTSLNYVGGQVSVTTGAATGAAYPLPPVVSLPGRLKFGAFRSIGGGTVLVQDAAGPLLMSRKVGRGQSLWVAGPLIPGGGFSHTSPQLWNAAAFLSALAGSGMSIPSGQPADAPGFGDYALATTAGNSSVLLASANLQEAWQTWDKKGNFNWGGMPPPDLLELPPTAPGVSAYGGVSAEAVAPAHGSVDITFLFTWRLPNLYAPSGAAVGNHYATLWPDARAVAVELAADPARMVERTAKFRSVFYDSTLPYWLLDAVTSQAGILRHRGVVFQLAAGDIYGWEGSNGCCGPTCTHVWGYEQSLSSLYPELERRMRFIDFKHQQAPDGGIHNRTDWPSPPTPTGEGPFADGHSSCVLKAYREALNTSEATWLTDYWPQIQKAVDHLIAMDAAGKEPDGIIEGDQPNTYDCSIHGANSFIGAYYLAALRAGEEMALRVGDAPTAARYRQIFEMGSRNLVARCWNGDYFQQDLPTYMQGGSEYGPGCLSDQLIGQWWANLLGLGYLVPQDHVRKALASIFQYNWLPDMSAWHHNQRWFAGGKDKGLLVCSWPRGGRPDHPIYYCDEVWSGIEYQVASLMLHEGMITEGLSIARGVRDRYDGIPRPPIARNPWSELECGGHYARAMSSWSLLRTLSGFHHDAPNGHVAFSPQVTPDKFSSFFTTAEAWGSLRQTRTGKVQTNQIQIAEGQIVLSRLELTAVSARQNIQVKADGAKVDVSVVRNPAPSATGGETAITIQFKHPVHLRRELEVRFG
ncbi:MAG: glycoside hydrolase family 116 protein, partial [Armatimonadota bacterium]|nr:glycoside hydrolase family 116 protein [Armatimonadota bacterium]